MNKLKQVSFVKIALLSAGLLAILAIAGYFWRLNQRVTVAQGEKIGIGTFYGYKIENYLFTDRMAITIWVGMGSGYTMRSVYDLPALTVEKVAHAEWIDSDGAIYLEFLITYHDSVESTEPTRIIYNFHRGEMYVTSNLTLWRMWNQKLRPDDWMSVDEFNVVLSKLEQ